MENSVTSDAAGVQKNIAKMYEEHAKKLGKTTDSLTQAEKAQAVYNGIMEETAPIVGSAAQIASQYEGAEAQKNAELLKTKQLLGESLIPTYNELSKVQKTGLSMLNNIIKNNKSATSGVVTFTTVLLAGSVAVGTITKAIKLYKDSALASTIATQGFTTAVLANPIFMGTVGISVVIALLNSFNAAMQESISKIEENTERSKAVTELIKSFKENDFTYTETQSVQAKNIIQETKQIISSYDERKNRIKEIQDEIQEVNNRDLSGNNQQLPILKMQLQAATDELKKFEEENLAGADNADALRKRIEVLNKTLDINATKKNYNSVIDSKTSRQQLINIAQTKADIEGKQRLLNILKKGKTTTDEYADAKSQLVKVYPELARVNENTIESTQKAIDAENAAANAEWANAQVTIQTTLLQAQAMATNYFQIRKIAEATQQKIEDVTASLQNQISVLSSLAKLTPEDFKGSIDTRTYTPKVSKSSSYSNKRLDNYKKEIEHKKALDQLSLQQEISMYETALKKYTKTTDEKRELREKIYELNKELAQKEKELLEQQTEDYEAYIQQQKNLRGSAYNITEQTSDYNKIIQMHRNYLNQIMKDERLSLDERKQIYREELQTIRDYEQQKRDLRVEQIDNTVSQLTNAITKQLEEMQEKDKEFIDKQIEEIEKLKEIRINAINAEYDAKIEAIEKELQALDKAEQQKSRDEEDAEYENKKKRLEDLVAFEHDATTKANYQKELDKLVAEYQKTLDKRTLEDKKEVLNAQKDLLQQEQDNKVQAVEDEVEKQKEVYNKQLTDLEEYYNKQLDMAQETAESMLLNVEQNQDKILSLLKSYGNAYEITGQSLGEKLAQGINEGLASKIENIVARIQNSIDAGIEAQISKMVGSVYRYEAAANKPQTKTITITQQNYIEQNPEMPSETYRKLNNVSQKLAEEFAGM